MNKTYLEVAIAIAVAVPVLEGFCAMTLKYMRARIFVFASLLTLACATATSIIVGNWALNTMSGIFGPFVAFIFVPIIVLNIWLVSATYGFSYILRQQGIVFENDIDGK